MKTIGCDLHMRYQQIAMVETAAGPSYREAKGGGVLR
jgi:hypothetical protein